MEYQEVGFISLGQVEGVSEGPMGVLREVHTKENVLKHDPLRFSFFEISIPDSNLSQLLTTLL
jgi:hypothetical protein